MKYIWLDYNPVTMSFVEEWLDSETIKETGLDDGWQDFYEYWLNEENTIHGENYWCKVIYESDVPFAVIAIGYHDGKHNIMELVVNPEMRNYGKGTELLKELFGNAAKIVGAEIKTAEAVIYPSNSASQKAFEKAGFEFDHAHEDADVLYYKYRKRQQ